MGGSEPTACAWGLALGRVGQSLSAFPAPMFWGDKQDLRMMVGVSVASFSGKCPNLLKFVLFLFLTFATPSLLHAVSFSRLSPLRASPSS